MAKYVCKNLGICDHANEEVEVLAGSEPKCPHCDMALHLLGDDGTIGGKHDGAAGRSGGRRISIAVAIALILLGGTGYFAYSAKVNNDRQASSPTPAISSSDGNGKVGATVGLSPNESEVRALRAEGDAIGRDGKALA